MPANNTPKQMQFKDPAKTGLGKSASPLKLRMWELMGLVYTVLHVHPNILPMFASGRLVLSIEGFQNH